MPSKTYFYIASTVFTIVAILHFLRIILGWPVNIGNAYIPGWASWAAFILAGVLAIDGWVLANKGETKNDLGLVKNQTQQKTDNLKIIIDLLTLRGKVTNNEVENMLEVSDATATNYLSELEKKGKVRQVGSTGAGVYYERIE